MHFVYVIYNIKTNKYYVGVTENVNSRIQQHKRWENISTKHKCEYRKLVYCEMYINKKDAYKRERRIKHYWNALRQIKERIKNSIMDLE